MSDVLWRRLGYMLSPQLDIYHHLAPRLKDKTVLDVGFGTGFGTLQFLPYAKKIYGVDIDTDGVIFADKYIPGVEWSRESVLKDTQQRFDVVVMIEVLEHIPEWTVALQQVKNRLYPEGEFYISARNANSELRKNDLHEREWTGNELYSALRLYFNEVTFFNYSFENELPINTKQTPIIAMAR